MKIPTLTDGGKRVIDLTKDGKGNWVRLANVCELIVDICKTDDEKVVSVEKIDELYEAIVRLPKLYI